MMILDRTYKSLINKFLLIYALFIILLCGSLNAKANEPVLPPVVVEVIFQGGAAEQSKILDYCIRKLSIPIENIYQWNNHLVLYGRYIRHDGASLKSKFTDCIVKLYEHPFYVFQRIPVSDGLNVVAVDDLNWDNIILTANLVDDQTKQQEYLNYHKTQFQKWPEVSQGFRNAHFEQLLVFKNGRQLMLIISIPKGQSLDKLNPLTTKNNPRMDEWNKIMAKYQEGIPGTKPGETWVFFKKSSWSIANSSWKK